MKKPAIGHTTCPTCDHPDAEVKEDKNGHAFIFCPDCNQQLFTRGDHRDAKLRKKMRPVSVTVTEPEARPVQPVQPVPEQKPEPKKKSWLSPILGGE